MNLKKLFLLAVIICCGCHSVMLNARLRSGVRRRIRSGSRSNFSARRSRVVNKSSNMRVGGLRVNISRNATLEGLSINFERGGYTTDNGSDSEFSGYYNPRTSRAIVANASYRSLPGNVNYPVELSGNASLEGVGNFTNPSTLAPGDGYDGIILTDSSTKLTINSQSTINSNILLNGGMAILDGNLDFGGESQFTGEGYIEGNGNAVILGGKDLILTSTLNWIDADIEANSRLSLFSTWNFYGDVHFLGRGNVLDLSAGGDLVIKNNSVLYIANLNIKGLGGGTIQFQDDTGQLFLSSCTFELDDDYVFNTGGIFIDGTTTVIVKDKTLTIDSNASMTIDGVTLWYDTLGFDDQNNIKPTPFEDPNQKYISYFNDGVIKHLAGSVSPGGDVHYTSDVNLGGFTVYSPDRRVFFDATLTFNGDDNVVYFASNGFDPISFVADDSTVTFTTVQLKGYIPSFTYLGLNSHMIFEDGTTIELGRSDDLNTTWTFRGQCVLRGNGHTLNLGSEGAVVLQGAGSSLYFDDIEITGLSGTKIRCTDNTSTISLRNVIWTMDNNYSLTKGRFDVIGKFELNGAASFAYHTTQQSNVYAGGMLFIDMDTLFAYAPFSANRDLIYLDGPSAVIYLNGATLYSTTTGLRLTSGMLVVDKVNYIINPGAVSVSEGVEFGDGTIAGVLDVNIVPGGKIDVLSGCLNIN